MSLKHLPRDHAEVPAIDQTGEGALSQMSATNVLVTAPSALAERVAMVRAQLQPIRSRWALLDSYRRESICRLAAPALTAGSAAEVLELAYAMRWLELASDATGAEMPDGPNFE